MRRHHIALVALLCSAAAVWGEGAWSDWSACDRTAGGTWVWSCDRAKTHVSVGRGPRGCFTITLGPSAVELDTPHAARVQAGRICIEGLPQMTLQFQEGKLRCELTAQEGERFFGLGEKFNSVDQTGKAVNMWVDDGYRSLSDRTYLPVPMYLSSRGYGLYMDSSAASRFDMASGPSGASGGAGRAVVIELQAPEVVLHLWRGDDYPDLMQTYCALTGLPEAPPQWAFGLLLSRSAYSSQKQVLGVARRWRALELPGSVFNIEGWKGGSYHTFDAKRFPDPRAMIRELHEYGWKVMLWNTHNLPVSDPDYAYGDEHGFFAKGADGKTHNVPSGYGSGGCIDVTNPDAVAWWNGLYDPLIELGVDALFNDITNYLDDVPSTQREGRMVFSNGKTSAEMHNLYWMFFNRHTYEYMKARTGNDTMLRSAGGWAGQQQYSTIWAGDSMSTWEFLERDIKALLSAGWSGIPYFGFDIPGYARSQGPPSPELYIRWLQFGALSPLMQFHSTSATEPWHYSDEAVGALRTYGWLRDSFLPYIYSLALEAEQTGAPIARSLTWHYPDDATALGVEDEFLLGPNLLVAPIYKPGGQRKIYLPAGEWMDMVDGSWYEGPLWVQAQAPLLHLPVYMRAGAIIPVKLDPALNVAGPTDESHVKALEILPPPHRRPDGYFVWRTKGHQTRLTCRTKHFEITLRAHGDELPTGTLLRFEIGPPDSVFVDNQSLPELSLDEIAARDKKGYYYRKGEQVCFVNPGRGWSDLLLSEEYGQLRFEDWSGPAIIASNARRVVFEVSLSNAADEAVPALVYSYGSGKGVVLGRHAGESRWRFELPLKVAPVAERIEWTVIATAKTGEMIQSRPRITTVRLPARVRAPETIRLDDEGFFDVEVISQSRYATKGALTLSGPDALRLTPARLDYSIRGVDAKKMMRVRYRVDPAAQTPLGIGEHPLTIAHSVAGVALEPVRVLAARPPTWHIAGPFMARPKEGQWRKSFQTVFAPEEGPVDLQAEYPTPEGAVGWKIYPRAWIGEDGLIDIERVYGKIDGCVAYLYTTVESPVKRRALLQVGSDDALTMWLNGRCVGHFPVARAAARDQDKIPVTLNPGTNTILAKVFDLIDAWRLYLRVTDVAGKPIGDLREPQADAGP